MTQSLRLGHRSVADGAQARRMGFSRWSISEAATPDGGPRPWRRRLLVVCAIVVIVMLGCTLVAVAANWPDQFDDPGPDSAAADFIWTGTALSPPLVGLALVVWFAISAARSDRWGSLSVLGLMLISGLFMVGSVAQALGPVVPQVPDDVRLAGGALNAVAFALVLIMSLLALREDLEAEVEGRWDGSRRSQGG